MGDDKNIIQGGMVVFKEKEIIPASVTIRLGATSASIYKAFSKLDQHAQLIAIEETIEAPTAKFWKLFFSDGQGS